MTYEEILQESADKYKRYEELHTRFGKRPECSHVECNLPGEMAFGFDEKQTAVVMDCMVAWGVMVKVEEGKYQFGSEYGEYERLKQELFYS